VGPSAGPSVLASVPRGGAFELSQEHKVRHAPCTSHLAARVCSHARHLRTHSAPFSAPHRRWCVLQMLITSPRGNLPSLPGNWDASPGIQVKTCDKKERNKTNVHLMQQTSYISSMTPRTMLDMLVRKEMGVLAAVNNACMQSSNAISR
jgi:hypothetical protein